MTKEAVTLKKGKEKAIRNRHHWIFSGAIASYPKSYQDGEIYSVVDSTGSILGNAYFNRKTSIAGRMISFDESNPLETMHLRFRNAIQLRQRIFDSSKTNAMRLVNAEGDLLPGIIIDIYDQAAVFQISTLGMEKIKSWWIEQMIELLQPKMIYEKSILPARSQEGLSPQEGVVYGTLQKEVNILENGLKFVVPIAEGQKTGFFLDHRDMRKMIQTLSGQKKVLNCFCYSGAFSIYASAGGAIKVDSVDISKTALELAERNAALNGFADQNNFFCEDVFQFLRDKPLNYDIVILDPPAFAKKKQDVVSACRGYKEINRLAMQKMPIGSLLLTCSCSYHVDRELFQTILFQAAIEAGRSCKIIGTHHMAMDHPINICHPEMDYLKSFLLYIE